jgi:two-component system, NtrC family, sensor kinase
MIDSTLINNILNSATHTSIIVTDFYGKILVFNKGASNLFGYIPEEAKNKKLSDLTYIKEENDAFLFEEIVKRVKSEGWTDEKFLRQHKDGHIFPAISIINGLRNSSGEIIGILEITQNMPNLFRLERELKSSKDFLENILESSIDAIVTTDVKGYITFVNRALKELIGQRGQQIIGKHISIYYKDGVNQAREIMSRLRKFGRIRDYEFDMEIDGRIVPIRTSDTLLYDDYGEIVGTMGVFQDITDRKTLSEKLFETQSELIQAVKMRALGDLVSGVVHEINNPLMASNTFLHLLEQEKWKSPEQKKRFLLLKDCNARIERIVKKLKEFSRQSKFEFASMNVNDAVMSVLAITRQQLLNHGIELKIFLPEGLPLVLGDINQIEQVLLNLIANAIDAMVESPDKVLIIETALGEKGQMVQIKVTDKGIGMTSEQIEQIFNPFFTTKDADEGTGLGLSISYRIIESHRGKIEVKSKQGKGTTFTVELPVYGTGTEKGRAKHNSGG